MRISVEGRYLFTAGKDGNLFVFEIKDSEKNQFLDELITVGPENIVNQATPLIIDNFLSEILLVSKNEIK